MMIAAGLVTVGLAGWFYYKSRCSKEEEKPIEKSVEVEKLVSESAEEEE